MIQTMKQATAQSTATNNQLLWQKINSFCLDDPDASFPFSKKLAKENKWSDAFARLAIVEYKKFLYLCCILPNGASPSHTVDQVWHLHLVYTQNYWEDFCRKTINRPLHHHPSTGSYKDQQKHEAWRKDTIENYRLHFGEAPPPGIWNDAVPANKPTNKPVTKIRLQKIRQFLLPFTTLPLILIISGCSGAGLFGSVIIIGLMFFLVGLASSSTPPDGSTRNKSNNGSGCGSSGCGGGSSGCSGGGGGCGGGGCGGGCGGCGGG